LIPSATPWRSTVRSGSGAWSASRLLTFTAGIDKSDGEPAFAQRLELLPMLLI
jgi:hypothetical protein